ncbi:MAG: hypothetical protein K9L74_03360 [Candidatus Izimaplasma sp.]|nr:hypothetical protein [Candidatus Izimaplasma bacterium]
MKIKQRLSKARSKISIKTYKRPGVFIIMMMVGINLMILVIAAFVATLINNEYLNVFDALVHGSVKWMLTPNAILEVEDSNMLVLAVAVLIVGMVLFTGTIIALTTNLIKEYFESKRSGSGKVYLEKHIVILNWNNKVPELVADLLHLEEEDLTVMILADIDKKEAEKQIVNAINILSEKKNSLSNLNVLVKNGSPLLTKNLYDISIEEAIAVIIMNKDTYETVTADMTKSDLNVVKTVLNVGRISYKYDPPIVAEIKRIETKEKIQTMAKAVETLKPHTLLPICFDRRLGQIIAQTIIHNYMEDVYLSLFSFKGSEVYRLKDVTFDACLKDYDQCVPLAKKGNDLFVLSESIKTIAHKSNTTTPLVSLKTKEYKSSTDAEIYVIGNNNKLQFMLNAFKAYEKIYNNEFSAKWIKIEELKSFIEDINSRQVTNTTKPITIVLLSDETQSRDSLDANVINNLIYLEGHIKRDDVNIIVELLDPNNDKIVKDFDINNTIISNKIISLLLSKLALFEETESFYENLLSLEINQQEESAQEAFIRKAEYLVDETFPIEFPTAKSFVKSIYNAFDTKVIPFGVIKNNNLQIISKNLHKKEPLIIEKTDLIVLMKL